MFSALLVAGFRCLDLHKCVPFSFFNFSFLFLEVTIVVTVIGDAFECCMDIFWWILKLQNYKRKVTNKIRTWVVSGTKNGNFHLY